jgi:nitrite reductase/ring-hydroxylating ferredoxin subunit
MKKIFFKSSFILLFGILISACNKKDENQYIPYVYVDFYISISNPQFVSLNAIGGSVNVTGGSKGIILYRKSIDEFAAYDRHCPYLPENTCSLLKISSSGTTAIDTCCGSEFLLIDGSVLKQPSILPMLKYQTSFDGNQLHVYN